MAEAEGTMTLAFELAALERLDDPEAVIHDARQWSSYIGIVSDKPTYAVTKFAREHRIRQDFFSGPRGREESLEQIRGQFETDRHVFVGVTDEDAALAERVGWEFLPVEEAAEAAGWSLSVAE
ncbi:MAG: DUF7124 domain-containing protein [Halobacteriota archaeon]